MVKYTHRHTHAQTHIQHKYVSVNLTLQVKTLITDQRDVSGAKINSKIEESRKHVVVQIEVKRDLYTQQGLHNIFQPWIALA